MKRTQPDSAGRFWASVALVAYVVSGVVITACGSMTFSTGVAIAVLAIITGFIAITQDA